jgi:hypothetical protein
VVRLCSHPEITAVSSTVDTYSDKCSQGPLNVATIVEQNKKFADLKGVQTRSDAAMAAVETVGFAHNRKIPSLKNKEKPQKVKEADEIREEKEHREPAS